MVVNGVCQASVSAAAFFHFALEAIILALMVLGVIGHELGGW